MARKITDEDIVEALTGTGAANGDVVEALRGTSLSERRKDAEILEALGGTPAPVVGEAEVPLKERGDELEAMSIWAATGAAEDATAALAQALMRADATKGIYAAEAEAREIASEAYAEAAKTLAYEDARQEHVKGFVTKLAERLSRPRLREASGRTPTPPAPKVTVSKMTGRTIITHS